MLSVWMRKMTLNPAKVAKTVALIDEKYAHRLLPPVHRRQLHDDDALSGLYEPIFMLRRLITQE